MKVALLTIWHVGNYGAELQTYCTTKVIKDLGHDIQVIDYRLSETEEKPGGIIRKIVWFFIKTFTLSRLKKEWFWYRHIPKTNLYKTKESLLKNPPKASIYIVGSDQVWNPQITGVNADLFFLNFGPSSVKRASYASSFGVSKWSGTKDITDIAKRQLQSFVGVSCRELSGVHILNNEFGVEATNVLDPTLLLDNYNEIIGSVSPKQTLAYYPLRPNKRTADFCLELCKEQKLTFVKANYSVRLLKYIEWDKASIHYWLKSIAEASLVVTSSFHGTAVSIVLHKPFIVVVTEQEILERSSRIIDLLKLLGLEERYFTDYNELKKSRIWEKEIDYNFVDEKLSRQKNYSIDYLKRVLAD